MHNLKRHIFLLILIVGTYGQTTAQSLPDSVIRTYKAAKTQKEKMDPINNYLYKPDSNTSFFSKATMIIGFLQSVNDTRSQDIVQLNLNNDLAKKGEYTTALASTLEITNRFEQQKDKADISYAYAILSAIYFYAGEKEKSIIYGKKALLIARGFNNAVELSYLTNGISTSYSQNNMPDSALLYARQAISYLKKSPEGYSVATVLSTLAEAFIAGKQYDSALIYARQRQGTGLGLSLSYDIIKAHGGEIKVKTKEGEGTEFIIILQSFL